MPTLDKRGFTWLCGRSNSVALLWGQKAYGSPLHLSVCNHLTRHGVWHKRTPSKFGCMCGNPGTNGELEQRCQECPCTEMSSTVVLLGCNRWCHWHATDTINRGSAPNCFPYFIILFNMRIISVHKHVLSIYWWCLGLCKIKTPKLPSLLSGS